MSVLDLAERNAAIRTARRYIKAYRAAKKRIASLSAAQKKIAELEAERDEARNRNASVELEAVGYSNRMHEALARAEAVEQALTAERHRRESAETTLRELFSYAKSVWIDEASWTAEEQELVATVRTHFTRYASSDSEERDG